MTSARHRWRPDEDASYVPPPLPVRCQLPERRLIGVQPSPKAANEPVRPAIAASEAEFAAALTRVRRRGAVSFGARGKGTLTMRPHTNAYQIREAIQRLGTATKAQIAAETGIPISSCGVCLKQLREEGYIRFIDRKTGWVIDQERGKRL